jgi:hypothetical protein
VQSCIRTYDFPTMSWSLTQVYINSPHQSKDKTFLFCNLFIHVSFNLVGIVLNICSGVKVVSSAPFCPYRRIYARPSLLKVRQVRLHEFERPHQRCSKLCATLPRKIDAAPLRPHGHASRVQLLSLLPHQCHTTACSTWHRSDNASREASGLANATMKL